MTARGSMEAESVPHTQRHSRFCQHAVPQQFLSMLACHCTTWCRYYSRVDTISLSTGNRADTIRGNTVHVNATNHFIRVQTGFMRAALVWQWRSKTCWRFMLHVPGAPSLYPSLHVLMFFSYPITPIIYIYIYIYIYTWNKWRLPHHLGVRSCSENRHSSRQLVTPALPV